ncbi:hypothetical protein ACFX4N_24375 [Priestia sp. YIM B13551]|uniref:hypothetical protein n=1 Tax=Priestia sp. YIM B13551 TaxID=3366306 RepID=UPI00366C3AC8
MIWIILLASLYVLVGAINGLQHTFNMQKLLEDVEKEEQYLMEMVRMYELTPSGAEYYAKLQDLHIFKSEALAELKVFKKGENKYLLQTFLLSFIFWPYFVFALNKSKKREESGR